MDYAQQQRSPGKHLTGIIFVLILHAILGYALINGLATRIVEAVKKPLETTIIKEVKPPPPPDTPPPPPPKMVQVLPTFVPPPEVQIQAPQIAPVFTSPTTNAPPPVFAPPAPPAPAVAAAAPSVGVACPNSQQIRTEIKYPPQARKDGLQGEVLIEFTVAANGEIKDIDIKSSSNRAFNSAAINATRQFKCTAQARDVRVQVPYSFKLTD